MRTQVSRRRGLRFTNPFVTYVDGKRRGKWPCGHRRNPARKHRGRRHPSATVVKK